MSTEPHSGEGNRWVSRISSYGDADPSQLLANPLNARIHPRAQAKAVTSMLDEFGWVTPVIVNEATGFLVDGHLRVAEAISAEEQTVPVVYVQLSDEEERAVVAFYDATAGMAVVDPSIFTMLIEGLELAGPLTGIAADILSDSSLVSAAEHIADDASEQDFPDANSLSWGYATFGKTKVACSVSEVDGIHSLWETYKAANGGLDVGFVRWLSETDR